MATFTEDELVAAIARVLPAAAPGVRLGPGDDAAVVEFGPDPGLLTVDMLVEGVDFDLAAAAPRDIGFKAVAVNLSDVAAMGGSPRFAVAALGLPPATERGWVVELVAGMREAGDEHGLAVVGGDLSAAPVVVISVTVTGGLPGGRAVTRAGARPGDRVVVTGTFGAAAGGLALLRRRPGRDDGVAGGDDAAGTSPWAAGLLRAQLRPVARVAEGRALAAGGASAMIDASDGLAKDLGRLCAASGVRGAVRLGAVPVAPGLRELARTAPIDPMELALGGGEDFELIATLPAGAAERLRGDPALSLTEIGEIREGAGLVAIEADGGERPLEPRGWDHFADRGA